MNAWLHDCIYDGNLVLIDFNSLPLPAPQPPDSMTIHLR
jgi:hypothetical protein